MKQRLAIAIWNEMMRCRFLRFSLDSNGCYYQCIERQTQYPSAGARAETSERQCRDAATVLREIADALDSVHAAASEGGAR